MRDVLDTLFLLLIIKMIFADLASLIMLSLQFAIALLVLRLLGLAMGVAIQSFLFYSGVWRWLKRWIY